MPEFISQEMFEEAVSGDCGWCTNCLSFTRDETEPDAIGYDCPCCEENTVMGAEQALLTGEIIFNDDSEEGEEVSDG